MRREDNPEATVSVGDTEVTIIRKTSKCEAMVARILGTEDDGRRIYLDRLLHAPWESKLGDWACDGAVSTILSRPD